MMLSKRDPDIHNKRVYFKRGVWILGCICFIGYILFDFSIHSKLLDLKRHFAFEMKINIQNTNRAYFVDMIGCKMPSFNIIDDNIAQYMYDVPKINCGKPIIKSTSDHIYLNMNNTELLDAYNILHPEKISCQYKSIYRKTDDTNIYSKHYSTFNLHENATKIDDEFIKLNCKYGKRGTFYTDFDFFVTEKGQSKKFADRNSANQKLSVMIIGIDSVSRLNFHRQMNTTATLLRRDFDAIELFGYNKVGDNTYPNLVPVLSGLDENELNTACLANGTNSTYDECPFLWKRFKDNGYQTVYAEDVADLGLFNYFRKGFKQQPADYYLRPMILEMEKNVAYKLKGNIHLCLGNRRPVDIIFDYIKKLIPQFKSDNFFSFFWMASLTHDFFNMPTLIDDDVFHLFTALNKSGVLNKTAVFLMSDHGLRWGSFRNTYQGMMEERQPFLYIVLPSWFKSEYPTAMMNLQQNTRKLTTHFDLHATLLDIMHGLPVLEDNIIKNRVSELHENEQIPRGLSLFLPIPPQRTCENAAIASHWCTCHEKQSLHTTDQRVQKSARFIVRNINKMLETYSQCRVLYLNSIFEANIGASNLNILKQAEKNVFVDVTVRIQTKPGMGEFEATVRLYEDDIELTGTISRTNLYGKQSFCVDDYTLKMYCYCSR